QSSLLSFTSLAPPAPYSLSLHDALPIYARAVGGPLRPRIVTGGAEELLGRDRVLAGFGNVGHPELLLGGPDGVLAEPGKDPVARSEEHTSELQSRSDLVCRLLLEKKKKK